jgi:hypothetical protein
VGFLEVGVGGVSSTSFAGLWISDGAGGLDLLARAGDPLPDGSGASYGTPYPPALGGGGDLAFETEIGPYGSQGRALVFVAQGAAPVVALRSGALLEVAPGDARRVTAIAPLDASAQSAGHRLLNEARQLATVASFDDGSEGVVLVTVPEPARALLLLGGAALLFGPRAAARVRRRRAHAGCEHAGRARAG